MFPTQLAAQSVRREGRERVEAQNKSSSGTEAAETRDNGNVSRTLRKTLSSAHLTTNGENREEGESRPPIPSRARQLLHARKQSSGGIGVLTLRPPAALQRKKTSTILATSCYWRWNYITPRKQLKEYHVVGRQSKGRAEAKRKRGRRKEGKGKSKDPGSKPSVVDPAPSKNEANEAGCALLASAGARAAGRNLAEPVPGKGKNYCLSTVNDA
ncbi:predicted protein [Pyrenophora tritici-repentis Pt-1C-BFP]|uniref:Uncharacterized protein n=1 Tax=Pyrenophora tritici-repentis (strain Pt-1C-BFP) TaxID=426418 RepID=B2WJN5_PYRTR|nr:uncharacterized protein PTRG_10381 [Pyrenophora tritici-repentis Pt-1C-BFP]EDU43432.1 predicted protein [Pyrenophora tritici-repentis Pt-1C-BFP]